MHLGGYFYFGILFIEFEFASDAQSLVLEHLVIYAKYVMIFQVESFYIFLRLVFAFFIIILHGEFPNPVVPAG